MLICHNLKPIFNEKSKILIMGSMPSVISRKENFYYANKNNRFWKILEELFLVKLVNNEDKINFLLDNHIALWDVFKSVDIVGSSDSSIKNPILNDFNIILNRAHINAIFCTGKAAYNGLINNCKLDILIFYLPSPSSANASFSLNRLVNEYKIIKKYI